MQKRLVISGTEQNKRAYSYLIKGDYPIGIYTNSDLPDEILNELEALGQSDNAPAFLWNPEGSLLYAIVEDSAINSTSV